MEAEVCINHRQYIYSVELPPQKMDTENPKVLELGQDMEKPQLSIEVSLQGRFHGDWEMV